MSKKKKMLLGIAMVLCLCVVCQARIKLVALPERAATVIRLDNPNATLIEEERVLTLQKGINKVDFSWKGVSIDADSIRLAVLDHPDTHLSVRAERAFLHRLEGGCTVPAGAWARTDAGGRLILEGVVADPDGAALARTVRHGDAEEPELLGTALAEDLLAGGAEEILHRLRGGGS